MLHIKVKNNLDPNTFLTKEEISFMSRELDIKHVPEKSQKCLFLFALQDRCVAALARVERTDFLFPMFIGEVAHVSAEISFTSKHSVEVQVNVVSENILTG